MEPIKFQKQNWTPVESKKEENKPVKIGMNAWKQAESSEPDQKKAPVKVGMNAWKQAEEIQTKQKQKPVEFAKDAWQQVERREKESRKVEAGKQAWNPITGLQPPNVMKAFEGMNQMNPFAIKDSQATRTKNVTTQLYPSLTVRDGFSILNDLGTAEVDGLAVYEGKELHVIAGGIWQCLKGGVWTTLKTGLKAGQKWSFVNFQGSFTTMHLIAANGYDTVLKYNGTTVSALANAPALCDHVATHDNRVYMAGNNTVYYSALRKAEDWNTVGESGSIVVETTDGKSITGVIAGSSRLTIFKGNSIHELFGTRPDNYTMKMVTDNLGCPTGRSAKVIEGVIYFLGNDGVYRYSGGSLPDASFSLPVQEEIKKLNKTYAHKSIAWAIGRKYYLAIPTGAYAVPNVILEYDIDFNAWNVWEFPNAVSSPFVELDGVTYGGNQAGEIMKFDSNKDGSFAIEWEWVTKPFSFVSLAAKTRLYRLWIVADVPAGSTLNVSITDSSDLVNPTWTNVQTITADTNLQKRQILIPVSIVNHSEMFRLKLSGIGKATVYEISRQERVFPMGQ